MSVLPQSQAAAWTLFLPGKRLRRSLQLQLLITLFEHGNRRLRVRGDDAFLSDLYDQAPDLVVGSLANARRNLSKTRVSATDFVLILNNQKLTKLVARIRKRLADL